MKNDIGTVSVTIYGHLIGADAPPYIVAEMSGNHNHDLFLALSINTFNASLRFTKKA